MTNNNNSSNKSACTGIAARLARRNILELQPYRCARDDYSEGILLDANENSYGPTVPPSPRNNDHLELERYPDPYQVPLKQRFANFRHVDLKPEHIFVGVGSDEAIDLLMRIFCQPGQDAILTTPPTYGMYKVCAKVNDVAIVQVPLTPAFDVQVEPIINAVTPQVKLLFLCSPGNPTSKLIPITDMEAIVSSPQCQNLVVVVDEAYIDFAISSSSSPSAVSLLSRYSNLVVLQTLSKAFGLAAIRCGFCLGPPDIIQLMNNVKAPYNVNALTERMALTAFDHLDRYRDHVRDILIQRDWVMKELQALPFVTRVFHSDANFILFSLKSHAKEVYKTMADAGIVTRYRGNELHCPECIRVTVGTPEQNKAFLQALPKHYYETVQA